MLRRPLACIVAALLWLSACKREPEPVQYPASQAQALPGYAPAAAPPAPAPSTAATGPAPPTAPAPPPGQQPSTAGPMPAAGLPCALDNDLVCAFGRCVSGRCGGCRNDADCKAGAACTNTPVGLACAPTSAPPAPTPSAPPSATSPPTPTPAPTPTPTPAPSTHAEARERCLLKTNEYRATKGLAPLTERMDRQSCADGQAQADATKKGPHGSFGQCSELAQNECPGWRGAPEAVVDSCLKAMFAEGPGTGPTHGHYSNLMNPGYSSVACGFFVAADGTTWMVQDFFK